MPKTMIDMIKEPYEEDLNVDETTFKMQFNSAFDFPVEVRIGQDFLSEPVNLPRSKINSD